MAFLLHRQGVIFSQAGSYIFTGNEFYFFSVARKSL